MSRSAIDPACILSLSPPEWRASRASLNGHSLSAPLSGALRARRSTGILSLSSLSGALARVALRAFSLSLSLSAPLSGALRARCSAGIPSPFIAHLILPEYGKYASAYHFSLFGSGELNNSHFN